MNETTVNGRLPEGSDGNDWNQLYYGSDPMRTVTNFRRPKDKDSGLSFPNLKLVDLFAGIGGIRLAFQRAGCRCVFSSEWDMFASLTYEGNFGDRPATDRKV